MFVRVLSVRFWRSTRRYSRALSMEMATRPAISRSSARSYSEYASRRVDCTSITPTSLARAVMGTAISVRVASTVFR